jgi:hypothetical protein
MKQIRRYRPAATIAVLIGFGLLQIASAPTRNSFLSNYDHGYQLGVGVQLLHGKLPGVDVLTHYGPLVFCSSAGWYWLSGSLLGETIACAVAYALCLTIIYAIVARHISGMAGLLGASAGFLLEARFYKWYVWLFPLGTVWLLDRVSGSASGARKRWIAATGFWVGVCWLFRWDVGTTGAAACGLFLWLTCYDFKSRIRFPWRDWVALGVPFVVPPLAWFVYLLVDRGWAGPRFYLWASLKGAVNLSRAMALPMPRFNPAEPLSPPSIVVLSYALVITTYLVCGIIGLGAEWRGRSSPRSRLLLAIALVGLSTFHQGFYRKGAYHLLQIVPPAIVGSCLLISVIYEVAASAQGSGLRARAVRFAGFAFLAGTAVTGLGLMPCGRVDLAPMEAWPRQRLRELAHPLEAGPGPDLPILSALREVHFSTDRNDPVLVFPVDSQYLALLDRPVSGRLTVFVPGFFDSGIEIERNLEAIRKSMPKIVMVAPVFAGADPARSSPFHQDSAKSHAYMLQFIEENYTRKMHECDRCVVLMRDEGPPVLAGALPPDSRGNSLERDGRDVARGEGNHPTPERR